MARLFYGSVDNDGLRLHYYRTGDEKPPVVLLHGITDNGLCWGRLAFYLEPDFDVIMLDARGHGLSDAPDGPYSVEANAADTIALIEHLELVRPTVIGHSMGAATAARVAATAPHLVGRVVLEDPPWRDQDLPDDERSQWAERMRNGINEWHAMSFKELLDACRTNHPLWDDEADRQQWAKAKQQVRPQIADFFLRNLSDWRETARKIRSQTLLITADPALNAIVTPEIASEVVKFWPRGSGSVLIPNAGHNIRRENFSAYLQIVSDFLFRK